MPRKHKEVKIRVMEAIAWWGCYGHTPGTIMRCIRKNVREGRLPRAAIRIAKRELGMR